MYAEHFPLENVRQNAFLHQMHLMQKCIFATHQMHFCIKCIFAPTKCDAKIYFCKASNTFLHSVHFPKENVQQKVKKHQTQHFCIKNLENLAFAKQKLGETNVNYPTAT